MEPSPPPDEPTTSPPTVPTSPPPPAEPAGEEITGQSPATIVLAASWVLVYAAMALAQGRLHAVGADWLSGGILPPVAYQFGSISTASIHDGQFWRAFNATFLHFSLVHLVINLVVFYQLGRVVEPWYGTGRFLILYAVIGVGGNLLAAWLRPVLGTATTLTTQSGGGSGVITGLIGLVAVVGWRERSRYGDYVLSRMAVQLILIGVMGMVIPHVDNLVHACGAVVGGLLGLMDSWLLRPTRKRGEVLRIAAFVALVTACVILQVAGNRHDRDRLAAMGVRDLALREQLVALLLADSSYRELATDDVPPDGAPPSPARRRPRVRLVLAASMRSIEQLDPRAGALRDNPALAPWRVLGHAAARGLRPDPGQVSLYLECQRRLAGAVEQERRRNLDRHEALCRQMSVQSLLREGTDRARAVNRPGRKPAAPPAGGGAAPAARAVHG